MNILCIGDVVGSAGTAYAVSLLPKIKRAEQADFVIVNAENAAPGNGLDSSSADELLAAGADVLTGGNHTLRRHEVFTKLDDDDRLLRPVNLPPQAPGKGYTVQRGPRGLRILVINAIGQVFMPQADNPFVAVDRLLQAQNGQYDLAVCDFHGEATSEKAAFARYFDGRISAVFGTHTHVQTADERVLPNGSGFISDIGMCGPTESVLGTKPEPVIKQFVTGVHDRFEACEGPVELCGVIFVIDEKTGKVDSVRRIRY